MKCLFACLNTLSEDTAHSVHGHSSFVPVTQRCVSLHVYVGALKYNRVEFCYLHTVLLLEMARHVTLLYYGMCYTVLPNFRYGGSSGDGYTLVAACTL